MKYISIKEIRDRLFNKYCLSYEELRRVAVENGAVNNRSGVYEYRIKEGYEVMSMLINGKRCTRYIKTSNLK